MASMECIETRIVSSFWPKAFKEGDAVKIANAPNPIISPATPEDRELFKGLTGSVVCTDIRDDSSLVLITSPINGIRVPLWFFNADLELAESIN